MAKRRLNVKPSAPVAKELRHLVALLDFMEKHQLGELEWETKNERIKLKSRSESVSFAPSHSGYSERVGHSSLPPLPVATAPVMTHAPVVDTGRNKQFLSPFVGTFYRAAAPGSAPYVKEGQSVKRGDVLCIIEAMKLMNEIDAEFSGKIVSILVENGQPVEFGEPLFLIEPA